jgi:hypothetical protein
MGVLSLRVSVGSVHLWRFLRCRLLRFTIIAKIAFVLPVSVVAAIFSVMASAGIIRTAKRSRVMLLFVRGSKRRLWRGVECFSGN